MRLILKSRRGIAALFLLLFVAYYSNVTLFEHTHKDLIDGVESHDNAVGIVGLALLADCSCKVDSSFSQLGIEACDEHILSRYEKRRELWIVVIPTPPLAVEVAVFHRLVCIETSTDGINPHFM